MKFYKKLLNEDSLTKHYSINNKMQYVKAIS